MSPFRRARRGGGIGSALVRGMVALLLACAAVVGTALAAGAWSDTIVLPTLRQYSWRYPTAPLQPAAGASLSGSGVTRVYWRYHYRTWQPGFRAVLCAQRVCVDASTERGWSDAFAGLPVASRFRFHFMVAGHGMLTKPMRGGRLRLIVNYK